MSKIYDLTKLMRRQISKSVSFISLSLVLVAVPFQSTFAQIAPSLGTADSFAVLASSRVTNTGPSIIKGDLGVSSGTAITGFPPGLVLGSVNFADAIATEAQTDTITASNSLADQACDTTFGVPADIGGLTLIPGVYCFSSSAQITGELKLNAQGSANAVWIFKVGSTLITATNSSIIMINGGQNCNVFWNVGSSATLGTDSKFIGNILAITSITLNTHAEIYGRALAKNGAVTLDSNKVMIASCEAAASALMVSKNFAPSTINIGNYALNKSRLTITLSNSNDSAANLTASFADTLPLGLTTASVATTTCSGVVTTSPTKVILVGGSIPANGSCTNSVLVTGDEVGLFTNNIPAGALQTNQGSNANDVEASLNIICDGKYCDN